jgi:hypothetical protein
VNGAPGSRIGAQLYGLLPEVYRARDKNGDLARYLDACGQLLDQVHSTLLLQLDDHFPDTCQEWLIPYFADLLDVATRSPEPVGRRAEVARGIAWRQRKGTASCAEEIAEAVGSMEAELQEGWRRVARTARAGEALLPAVLLGAAREPDRRDPIAAGRHPDLPIATVDLRRHSRAQQVGHAGLLVRKTHFPGRADAVLWEQSNPHGAPCFPGSYEDRSMRTVDLRTPDWQRGHFHPKRLLAFVPVADGFFPAGAPSFLWSEREQAEADGLLEMIQQTESRDGGTVVRRTIFRRPAAQSAPVRIRGAIELEVPETSGEERAYRFEGFYLANTLTVKVGRLEIERCAAFKVVVHKHDLDMPVLAATDCLLRHVQAASGLAQFEYCTVLAKTVCEAIQAIDSLFLGNLQRDLHDAGEAPRINCLRQVRVPPELIDALTEKDTDSPEVKTAKRSERMRVQRHTTDIPVFFKFGFGTAGAGVLHPSTPVSIRRGAEDGGELGAYHHQHLVLRWEAVREKFAEYLPLGMEPVLIPDARLGCVPPR